MYIMSCFIGSNLLWYWTRHGISLALRKMDLPACSLQPLLNALSFTAKASFNDSNCWNYQRKTPVEDTILYIPFQRGAWWATKDRGVHSPVDGGQFGGLPADGELRAVEISLSPGLVEREKSVAVAFELHPEERAQGSLGQLWHGWGQRETGWEEGWPCKHWCYGLWHLLKYKSKKWSQHD